MVFQEIISLQECNEVIDYLDKISQKISRAKGKKLIDFKKKQKFPNEYILTFIGLNGQNRCEISFKADNLEILKHDPKLNTVFYKRKPEDIVGKKLLKYQNWGKRKIS